MKPNDFVAAYLPEAIRSEKETGIAAEAILAQAALESGWGEHAPGNMFFGVKDTDGINGNEQLITTTEYSRRMDLKFPQILKVEPTTINGQKYFKYLVKDYFRKFNTPAECFTHHGEFFKKNSRYAKALAVKSDPYKFIEEIAKAGYATAPDYAKVLCQIVEVIKRQKSYKK